MKTSRQPPLLSGSHLRTYEKIFQHPVSHNLLWRDVLSLFSHLGDVSVELNGHLKVTCNGHALVLPTPRTKDVAEVDELIKLRFFLEHSGAAPPVAKAAVQMLLVLDHQVARLFCLESLHGLPAVILPHESADHLRQAHPARDFFSGKEHAAPSTFFAPIAHALQLAGEILIFGTGTGMSSEMGLFAAWLKVHHPDLARRIAGTVTVDEHHLTEPQLLAMAREFFAHRPRPRGRAVAVASENS